MSKSQHVQEAEAGAAAPPTMKPLSRAQRLLLDFLSDPGTDPPGADPPGADPPTCPVCGYNLKALTRPVCPECRHDLALTVGVQAGRLRLGWLLVALVPGFFCGIAACLLAIPTTAIYFEDGQVVWPFVGAVLFGWASGLFAMILIVKRNRFIAQPRSRQRWIVLILGIIHFIALGLFFLWMASQI